MKITFDFNTMEEFIQSIDQLINRGMEPRELLEKAKMYADQAAASASKSDVAARNAQMAAEDIKKAKQ